MLDKEFEDFWPVIFTLIVSFYPQVSILVLGVHIRPAPYLAYHVLQLIRCCLPSIVPHMNISAVLYEPFEDLETSCCSKKKQCVYSTLLLLTRQHARTVTTPPRTDTTSPFTAASIMNNAASSSGSPLLGKS
ncbi:hypothetical protein L211DRAFT_663804 [Terfezia boudieri ATCC MYA-4762]|uniref:Uncharacterized protein n=1 Tax=Terfezia boudieri ATCC MYA-4762 TaxID=1051890 RepID=A0A3N4L8A4_9PEZI|nr:hypothetical protein L211DRAFT_663804 [Terfezia boudieri ATCC MYA-4762]